MSRDAWLIVRPSGLLPCLLDEIGDVLDLKQASGERWPVEEIISRAVEIVQMPEMA